MGRLLSIGDVHGCYHTLMDLLEKMKPQKGDKLVFTGDYIDRGEFSKEVVDFVRNYNDCDVVTLRGNHEDMFLNETSGVFLMNGGRKTLQSYNYNEDLIKDAQDWIRSLPYSYDQDGFLFVHAGVSPYYDLDKQDNDDLVWIRDIFLESKKKFGKYIVHGHTPLMYDIDGKDSNDIVFRDNRVNIDTACVYGRCLTGIDVRTREVFQSHKNVLDISVSKGAY